MEFASFLRVSQVFEWQKFLVTIYDVYVTLGVLTRARQIIKITNGSTNRYSNKSVLKHMKDMNQIAYLNSYQFIFNKLINSVRRYKESKATKGLQPKQQPNQDDDGPSFNPTLVVGQTDSEALILVATSMAEASVTTNKEDHYEQVLMGQMKEELNLGQVLSQLDSQCPSPASTSVPNPNTIDEQDIDNKDDDDGAPLRFPLRNTYQGNYDVSINKSLENKCKAGRSLPLKRVR
ncbi:hypothetical protein Cgig2_030246 [Carnegiea gigantea]|uniref:Uncharacterized protein n=1 Tax=Carnegiea gigantea TaxID=171969 RepID=A0A9Q1JJA6_9CARY|nr:hypothetical protein Cgig2_030246 [Carnegiea gigantea]